MANISHFTQTVNGVSATYDIHDANAVDLTSNQTVGGIKTFSNAPVVSSINLDGKAIDTDANGDMTYDNHIVDTIEEQGDGYIRYSNGIQICWGSISVAIGTTLALDPPTATYYSRGFNFNYPKGFSSNPVVSFSISSGVHSPFLNVCCETGGSDKKLTTGPIMLFCMSSVTIQEETLIYIQAIGRWK